MPDPAVKGELVDDGLTAEVSRRIKRESKTIYNVRQSIIVIGRDRLTLVLRENQGRLVRLEVFLGVLALFAGLLLALLTGDFKDTGSVKAAQWTTGFFIATILAGGWLAYETWRLIWRRLTIEGLVDCIETRTDRPLD